MQRNKRKRSILVGIISLLIFLILQDTNKSWEKIKAVMNPLTETIVVLDFIFREDSGDSDDPDDENK